MTMGFSIRGRRDGLDWLGTIASATCAVHCALCALGPSLLSALGLAALFGHEAEWGFTAAAGLIAVLAMVAGWRRHRTLRVVVALATGIAGLVMARALEHADAHAAGTVLGVLGSIGLFAGHLLNLQASRRSTRESPST